MTKRDPFKYFKTCPELIRLAVMMYVRFPLSLRNVEHFLHDAASTSAMRPVRFWWNRFGPVFAAEIRKNREPDACGTHWQWHLDEVFVKINGEQHYLWRAVGHEGKVSKSYVIKRWDRKSALKCLRKTMKRHGNATCFRHRQVTFLRCGDEGHWQR